MVSKKEYQSIVQVFAMVTVFLSCSRNCAGVVYNVGGIDLGSGANFTWYVPQNTTFYQDWADSITFLDNDSLSFFYNASLHNIIVVQSLQDFDACMNHTTAFWSDENNPSPGAITLALPPSDQFTSDSGPKPFYFFSTFNSSDCPDGMKFKLNIHGSLARSPASAPSPGVTKSRKRSAGSIATTITLSVGIPLLIGATCRFVRLTRRKRKRKAESRGSSGDQVSSVTPSDWARRKEALTCMIYSYKELDRATNKFSVDNKLGSGGFGTVYKGILDNGTIVAVKRTNNLGGNDKEQFLNEVSILSQVNSRYLAKLLGCCVELDVPLLVFEFISNGTVQEHLMKSREGYPTKLDWAMRFRIAIQTAEALKYLHFQAQPPIFHRDVKTANILLTDNFNVKVADFGLSKLVELDATHVSTLVRGTPGYLDPEYYHNFQLTDKTDVYSFGMVLLELITSQKPVDLAREPQLQNLAMATIPAIRAGRTREIIDPTLISESFTEYDYAVVEGVAQISAACLSAERKSRPSMKEVVEMLQNLQSAGTSPTAQSFLAKNPRFLNMEDKSGDVKSGDVRSDTFLSSQSSVATSSGQATSSSGGQVELSCANNSEVALIHT